MRKPKAPTNSKFLGKAVSLIAAVFAANPKLATAFSGLFGAALLSAISVFTTNFAKDKANAVARESRYDSAVVLLKKMSVTLESVVKPDHDTLKSVNGACNEQPGCVQAKKDYHRKVAAAKKYIGIAPQSAPSEAAAEAAPPEGKMSEGKPLARK